MSSFCETRDALLIAHDQELINDEEFAVKLDSVVQMGTLNALGPSRTGPPLIAV